MNGSLASLCLLLAALAAAWPDRHGARRRLALVRGQEPDRPQWMVWCAGVVAAARSSSPRIGPLWIVVALAVGTGLAAGGPVAAAVVFVYGSLAVRRLGTWRRGRADATERARVMDAIGTLAAELRAGLAPQSPSWSTVDVPGSGGLAARARAVLAMAESTGAPVADLLDTVDADARAHDRVTRAAEAQAAGVRATSWLLAALPVGGIALGHAIGADALGVLLHTPLGAGCAGAAVVLQIAGLAWSSRLARHGLVAPAVRS